jgi:hypothetical protein
MSDKEVYTLKVHPKWAIAEGFDDKAMVVMANIYLEFTWPKAAENEIEDPRSIIHISNFASGASGVSKMGVLNFDDTASDGSTVPARASTSMYNGRFKQSLEEHCYPFDDKDVEILINIVPPGDVVFNLQLMCFGEGETALNANGDEVDGLDFTESGIKICESTLDEGAIGFKWFKWSCEINDDKDVITCIRKGHRNWAAPLKVYLIPSMIFICLSFCTFKLGVKLSMPRVATSMIALLNLTSLKNAITAKLPQSGEPAWLDEYMMLGQIFMFLNMLGHGWGFHLDTQGKAAWQKFFDDVSLYVSGSLFIMVVLIRLHVRECHEAIPEAASAACVACSVVLMACSTAFVFRKHRIVLSSLAPSKKYKDEKIRPEECAA